MSALRTGIIDLDDFVAIEPGDLVTLTGRTGVGMSSFAQQIARHHRWTTDANTALFADEHEPGHVRVQRDEQAVTGQQAFACIDLQPLCWTHDEWTRIRSYVTAADARLVVVDRAIDNTARDWKRLARDLDCIVLAVNPCPLSLENYSDVVIRIEDPTGEDGWSHPRAGELDLRIVKHRRGPRATITVANHLRRGAIGDLAVAE